MEAAHEDRLPSPPRRPSRVRRSSACRGKSSGRRRGDADLALDQELRASPLNQGATMTTIQTARRKVDRHDVGPAARWTPAGRWLAAGTLALASALQLGSHLVSPTLTT